MWYTAAFANNSNDITTYLISDITCFKNKLKIQCSFKDVSFSKQNSTPSSMDKLTNIRTPFLKCEDQRKYVCRRILDLYKVTSLLEVIRRVDYASSVYCCQCIEWTKKRNWCAGPWDKSCIWVNTEIITKYLYKRGIVMVTEGKEKEKEERNRS